MRQDLKVEKSVLIKASRQKVWQCLTTPEIIKEYLFGTETVTDWLKGSEIVFHGEYNGQQYRDHGRILDNIPSEKLSYSYWSGFSGLEDKPENYSTITCTLTASGDGLTQLTWTQQGFANEEGHHHTESNMDAFLDHIKEIAER
ncbi:MAG: SRPBCC domain-containing protein [Chitinophagales bacterium]|nr:SRPBCC domain-containing protein [Chitinophagales bacterium]